MNPLDRSAQLPRVLRVRVDLPQGDRPVEFADDICFAADMVDAFIAAYTVPGAIVIIRSSDFGTSLITAERLGRIPIGFEILPDRVAFIRSRLKDPSAVLMEDVREVDWAALPKADLNISAPPYMTREDHPQNPLSGGTAPSIATTGSTCKIFKPSTPESAPRLAILMRGS